MILCKKQLLHSVSFITDTRNITSSLRTNLRYSAGFFGALLSATINVDLLILLSCLGGSIIVEISYQPTSSSARSTDDLYLLKKLYWPIIITPHNMSEVLVLYYFLLFTLNSISVVSFLSLDVRTMRYAELLTTLPTFHAFSILHLNTTD